jgi:uncharacterized membrane protein
MLLAAVGDTPYRIVLFLHILAAMVAFAPAFTHPVLANQAKGLTGDGHRSVIGYMVANGRKIYAPAVIIAGFLGFALQGMSDGAWKMSQGWMIGAIVVWIAMNGVLHGMLFPGERKVAEGDMSGEPAVQRGGMIISLLLLVMLYLMIFKPGV